MWKKRTHRAQLASYFQDEKQLRGVIERIVGPLGRRIDESSPIVDARLPDGSRVNAIIPPVSIGRLLAQYPQIPDHSVKVDNLLAFGSLTRGMAQFLKVDVERRRNIVIAGGTGSGKTTLLDVISSFIPSSERIVTIEDSPNSAWNRNTSSAWNAPAQYRSIGAITIRDLVKNALRMRPDRIVVGECRGGEALDMLQAMNTAMTARSPPCMPIPRRTPFRAWKRWS
jgi:pilus assembly protein CpaF